MTIQLSAIQKNVCYICVLFFLGLYAFSYGETQPKTSSVNTNNFVTLTKGEIPWLERFYYYTVWPNTKDLPALEEIPNVQYRYEKLITEVLRENVLAEGWQNNVVRIKNWIPKQVNAQNPDAYLYRQSFDQGTLHICDSRPFLMIAYKSTIDVNFLEQPRESLIKAMSELLKFDEFNRISLEPGNSRTPTYFAHVGSPRRAEMDQFPDRSPEIPYSTYAMSAVVAEDAVFFEFQKFSVPGCVLDVRFPLFQNIGSKPTVIQKVLAKLEDYKEAKPEDIPDLIGLLKLLPDEPTPKQLQTDPYRFQPILSTKLEILHKIEASITSINNEENGVGLIQLAITAEKYFQRKDENPAKGAIRKMKEKAVDALRRIQSDAAALLNLKMVNNEKDPDWQERYADYLDDYPLFEEIINGLEIKAEAGEINLTEIDLYKALYKEHQKSLPIAPILQVTEEILPLQKSNVTGLDDAKRRPKQEWWIAVGIAAILLPGVLFCFGRKLKGQ